MESGIDSIRILGRQNLRREVQMVRILEFQNNKKQCLFISKICADKNFFNNKAKNKNKS